MRDIVKKFTKSLLKNTRKIDGESGDADIYRGRYRKFIISIIKTLFRRGILALQIASVLVYIFFEELIWESIALPLFEYLHSLKLLKKVEEYIVLKADRYLILLLFSVLFVAVEGAGIFAGLLMLGGMPIAGIILYGLKIPIAAFTFWLFRISKEKLLSFAWFENAYTKLEYLIRRLKSTEAYRDTVAIFIRIKKELRLIFELIRQKRRSIFVRGLSRLYRLFKKRDQ